MVMSRSAGAAYSQRAPMIGLTKYFVKARDSPRRAHAIYLPRMHAPTPRRRGITLLAALLTVYTMAGFLLALRVWSAKDERYRWWLIAAAALAFALASGVTTLAVWRVEKRAPALLVACGVLGSALCLALPAAAPAESLAPGMWRSAIQGAVLIFLFLLVAAWYVRNVVRARA